MTYCYNCDRDTEHLRMSPQLGGDTICRLCFETRCFTCGNILTETSGNIAYMGAHLCRRCHRRNACNCCECDSPGMASHMNQTPGGDRICHGCFEDSCVNCYNCGCAVWQNECTYYDDNPYCRRCYSRVHRDWDTKEFHCGDPHYDDIGSKRRFGIELETSECPNHYPLRETTLWGCKPDCSIEGLEFISPPLYGDEGLQDIYNFCREANFRGWNVDSRCGYHAHFDLTGETWQALRSIAYAYRKTYTMWSRFVSDGRSENAMCGTPRYRCENIAAIKSAEDWEYFVAARDRFEFLNWRAYLVHSTLEIRTHDPTLNVVEICNWIKVHTRFIDYVARLTIDEIDFLFGSTANKNFRVLSEIVGNTLADFYRDRARNFGKPVVRETVTA